MKRGITPAAALKKAKEENLEEYFLSTLKRLAPDLPPLTRQYLYYPGRRFRSDFAWPGVLLIEIEGGVWGKPSGHNTGSGIEKDCERSRYAAVSSYPVYRVTKKALDEDPLLIVAQLKAIVGKTGF